MSERMQNVVKKSIRSDASLPGAARNSASAIRCATSLSSKAMGASNLAEPSVLRLLLGMLSGRGYFACLAACGLALCPERSSADAFSFSAFAPSAPCPESAP